MEQEEMRPRFTLCHPNARGTGSALAMELQPEMGIRGRCIKVTLASQSSIGDYKATPLTFPSFAWDDAVTAYLEFLDIGKLMQVMRGEMEEINEGKGIYHRDAKGDTIIKFAHRFDPVPCYELTIIYCKHKDSEKRERFVFSSAEITGVLDAIAGAMLYIVFGR